MEVFADEDTIIVDSDFSERLRGAGGVRERCVGWTVAVEQDGVQRAVDRRRLVARRRDGL